MRNVSLIWLFLLIIMLFATCKSKEKARKVPEGRKFDTEEVSSVLYSAYLNVSELKGYKLIRKVHLPGINEAEAEDVIQVFYKSADSTEFELGMTEVYSGNLENLGIPKNFGNEMKYWLSFLPNPLLPHTYGKQKIDNLKELFELKEQNDDDRFRIFKLNKEKFYELPESNDPLFENLQDVTMIFDTKTNNIREYSFKFNKSASPVQEHIIVFDEYIKEGNISYPTSIKRTTVLNNPDEEEKNAVQQEIVENIQKMVKYSSNKETCNDLNDPRAVKACMRKWERALQTLQILNKMMADNIYTLEYDVRIKDVKMK